MVVVAFLAQFNYALFHFDFLKHLWKPSLLPWVRGNSSSCLPSYAFLEAMDIASLESLNILEIEETFSRINSTILSKQPHYIRNIFSPSITNQVNGHHFFAKHWLQFAWPLFEETPYTCFLPDILPHLNTFYPNPDTNNNRQLLCYIGTANLPIDNHQHYSCMDTSAPISLASSTCCMIKKSSVWLT